MLRGTCCLHPEDVNQKIVFLIFTAVRTSNLVLLKCSYCRGHVNKDLKDYRPKFLRTVQVKQFAAEVDLPDFLRLASSTVDSATMADLFARYNSENVRKANRRGKRDALEHVTDSIMKDIQKDIEKELNGLQVGIRYL